MKTPRRGDNSAAENCLYPISDLLFPAGGVPCQQQNANNHRRNEGTLVLKQLAKIALERPLFFTLLVINNALLGFESRYSGTRISNGVYFASLSCVFKIISVVILATSPTSVEHVSNKPAFMAAFISSGSYIL